MTVLGPLAVVAWTGPVPIDAPRAQRLLDAMQQLRSTSHRDLLLYAYVVAETASMPDGPARTIGARLPELFDHCAAIHEGDGLRSSVIRAVLTSMTMMARVRSRKKLDVVSYPWDAAHVLAPMSRGRLDEVAIHDAIESTRCVAINA